MLQIRARSSRSPRCARPAVAVGPAAAGPRAGLGQGPPEDRDRHEDGAGAGVPDPDARPTSCRPRSSSCRRASRSRPGPRACSTRARSARVPRARSSSAPCSSATRSTRFPPGKREPKVIIDKLPMAAGIAFDSKGNLYVATNTKIMRYDNIEDKLDNPGEPKVIYDKLPGGNDHSWKYPPHHRTTSSTSRSARRATSATRASTRRSTA